MGTCNQSWRRFSPGRAGLDQEGGMAYLERQWVAAVRPCSAYAGAAEVLGAALPFD